MPLEDRPIHGAEELFGVALDLGRLLAALAVMDARSDIRRSATRTIGPDRYVRLLTLFAAGVDRFIVTDHGGRPRTNYVLAHGSGSRWSRSRVTVRTIGERTFLFNRGGLLALARTRRFSFCAYPAYEAVIDIHGNVLICCNDYHAAHVFGNVRAHPLLAIWESPAMRAALASMAVTAAGW